MTTMCQISTAPGEDQHREQRVQHEARQVGGDHHLRARQPVGEHAADEDEADERDGVRREHEADVAGRPDLGDVERQRDEHDPVADRAGALREEQVPERSVPQYRHPSHGDGRRAVRRMGARMVRARSRQVRTPLRGRVPVRGPAHARAAARRGRAGRPRAAAVGGVPRRAAERDGRPPGRRRPSRARRASCSARTASRSAASPRPAASWSSTRSSTPSCARGGCCAPARSSTCTTRGSSSACSRSPARRATARC